MEENRIYNVKDRIKIVKAAFKSDFFWRVLSQELKRSTADTGVGIVYNMLYALQDFIVDLDPTSAYKGGYTGIDKLLDDFRDLMIELIQSDPKTLLKLFDVAVPHIKRRRQYDNIWDCLLYGLPY